MHVGTVVNALTLTKTHTHHDEDPPKPLEPRKIVTITTLEDFDQILEDHHHRRVIIFCITTECKEPDENEVVWYSQYERLNNVHFVRANLETCEELEERLQPKVKPCWYTFHKGKATGWSSGGMKRFVHMHKERKNST